MLTFSSLKGLTLWLVQSKTFKQAKWKEIGSFPLSSVPQYFFLRLCEVQLLQQVLQIKLRHTLFLSSDLMPLSGQRNMSVPSNTVIRVTVGFWHK